MKVELNIKYDLDMDLHCYDYILLSNSSPTFGVEDEVEKCLKSLPENVGEIVRSNVSREEKVTKLKVYLESQYKENKDSFEKIMKEFGEAWSKSGDQVIYCLERFYDKPFPFKDVSAYLTTNIEYPYSYDDRYFFFGNDSIENQLSTANHELNHFMYYHYYPELEEELGEEKSEILKESLTLFTDVNSEGFPDEQELRKLYISRRWKSADEVIEAGKHLLLK